MKISIPVDRDGRVYHSNPWTAPVFIIYDIENSDGYSYIISKTHRDNPWVDEDESIICDPMACSDGCSSAVKDDLTHLAEHYVILEVVHRVDYMVVDTFCENVEKVLKHAGITLFKIPSFIHDPDAALKNLLVNENITKNINNITTKTSS